MPLYSLVVLLGLIGFVSAYPVTVDRAGNTDLLLQRLATGPPSWLMLPAVFLAVAVVAHGSRRDRRLVLRRAAAAGGLPPRPAGQPRGYRRLHALSFLDSPPSSGSRSRTVVRRPPRPQGGGRRHRVGDLAARLFGYPLRVDTGDSGRPTTGSPRQKLNGIARLGDQRERHTASVLLRRRPARGQESLHPVLRTRPRTPKNVLIVGAGTGGDVAVALRRGVSTSTRSRSTRRCCGSAGSTDPDRAYQDPRVTAHVNDGRAFLQSTKRKYDLILFALPDSLTLVSGASSFRLESYLFTEQAVHGPRPPQAGRRLLDVQLLPRAAGWSTGSPERWRTLRALAVRVRAARQEHDGGADGGPDRRPTRRARRLGARRGHTAAGQRRPAVLVPRTDRDPVAVPRSRSG